jgi:predicted ATPase/DNA-binding SARP family transcriptional activator
MLSVQLLGAFEVSNDGAPVAIASRAAQSLFAYLILNAETLHRREKLAGLLWPDSPEEAARNNLRHALWRVRKALPSTSEAPYLLADDLSIAFNSSAPYRLDTAELEELGESASAEELIGVLSEYQGELLPGFYDEWVVLEREHLNSVFEHHMARLLSLLQDQGRWLDILDWAERWIKIGQKPEPAYRALMLAHAAKGDMSKVAATYDRCVKSLREFGIEPSEQTRSLYEGLKAGKGMPERKTSAPARRSREEKSRSNLPVPLTSFIGRSVELREIAELLSSARLLTLTGLGGVGKTRLAIQTANDVAGRFKDGVFWVELVGLSDANLMPQAIAQSLQVREVSGMPLMEALKNDLTYKSLLLVLDNCEHLVGPVAETAEQLLAACPRLRILATSRERLGIFSEAIWRVPTLSERTSRQLFTERAQAVRYDFSLTDSHRRFVEEICQRLDRIPLAIELAAARVSVLSVEEIAQHLNDRFSLLASGSRTALPRHQRLRATIDWSYDLLSEPERILFRRLAVFAGGFTLEGAEEVCGPGLRRGDILDLLGRLIDKSLVVAEVVSEIDETRYRLLETIRQYALEKLDAMGEAEATRNRHLEYFTQLSEEAAPTAFGTGSVRYYETVVRELDNIRAAVEWSIQMHQALLAFRLLATLPSFYFWYDQYFWYDRSSLGEWFDKLHRVLLLPEGLQRTAERAKALNSLAFFHYAGVGVLDPHQELEEALSIARELGDDYLIAQSLANLARLETTAGNHSRARSLFLQSLDAWRGLGTEYTMDSVVTRVFLGDLALIEGNLEEAQAVYVESIRTLREIQDQSFLAGTLRRLGHVACRQGEIGEASLLYRESLSINRELRDDRGIIACLAALAGAVNAHGKAAVASQIFGSVEALLGHRNIFLRQVDQMEFDRNTSSLRAQMDPETLKTIWTEGAAMTLEQAVAVALAEV